MAEELHISQGTKADKYELLYKQIAEVVKYESDSIALMANISAMIHQTFGFWWTGFYRVIGEELVLAPFQGPMACTRIAYGKGVCGTAWQRGESVVVEDVEQFPGHIACSSLSRSEIVVPVKNKDNNIVAVLDIDSEHLATFDEVDRLSLEKIAALLGSLL
jgi:GAF domain-containing protein